MRILMKLAPWICLAAILALAGGAAMAEDLNFPVVTGRHWVQSTREEKLAYVNGMATMIALEKEAKCLAKAAASDSGLIDGWISGLAGMRLDDMVAKLDSYFRRNPDRAERAVVEVLWYEVAIPNLDRQR